MSSKGTKKRKEANTQHCRVPDIFKYETGERNGCHDRLLHGVIATSPKK
jgi:hypothetical protein